MSELVLTPDRWIVCSPRVDSALRGPWADHCGPNSLLGLRLRSSQLESASAESTPGRVSELARQGCGTLHIVVERMGDAEQAMVHALETLDASMRLYVWRRGPLGVVGALNMPEDAVLQAWQETHSMPHVTNASGDWPVGYAEQYRVALQLWAQEARADAPEVMAEMYDAPLAEASTLREVIAALHAAGTATAAAGARAVVSATRHAVHFAAKSMKDLGVVVPVDFAAAKQSSSSFATKDSNAVRVMSFPLVEGLSLSVPFPGEHESGSVDLVADAQPVEMRSVARVLVTLVGTDHRATVDFSGDSTALQWWPDPVSGCFVRQEVMYTPELKALLVDPELSFEMTVMDAHEDNLVT